MVEKSKIDPEVRDDIRRLMDRGFFPKKIWVDADHWVGSEPVIGMLRGRYVEYVRADTVDK